MKTEKVNQAINKIVSRTQETPTPRVNLTSKPDVVDIPKREKPTFAQKVKILIRPYITHLDQKTVRQLERMPMENFWAKSQEIICDSYGIPANLRAPIQVQELPKGAGMAYSNTRNIVYVSPKTVNKGKNTVFSYLKHEYLHQKQNFDILRTENLGEKAVQEYTKLEVEAGLNNIKMIYRNMPEEEIEKLKPQLGEHFEIIMRYRKAVAQGEKAEQAVLDEIAQKDSSIIHKQLDDFRLRVVDEMGTIPADSKEAKISEEYLNGILDSQGNLTGLKAVTKRHETEAYIATSVSYWEYFIRKIGL